MFLISFIKKFLEKHKPTPQKEDERLIIGTPLYLDLSGGVQAVRELGSACYEIWEVGGHRCELRRADLDGEWSLIDDPKTTLTFIHWHPFNEHQKPFDELVVARNKISEKEKY